MMDFQFKMGSWFSIRWTSWSVKDGCFSEKSGFTSNQLARILGSFVQNVIYLAFQGSYLGVNWIVTTISACNTSIQGCYYGFSYITAKDLAGS